MKLKSIIFSQFQDAPRKWQLNELPLGDMNLLVGKNATGKSKILNIIRSLSNLLSRHKKLQYLSGNYEVLFEKNGKVIKYILRYEDSEVLNEELVVDNTQVMERGADGTGRIFSADLKRDMNFKTPSDMVAAAAKRDPIQHPFLEDLYEWGENLIHFYFGASMGKDTMVSFVESSDSRTKVDLKETDKVVAIFRDGNERFPRDFIDAIKSDMRAIEYELQEIDYGPPISVRIRGKSTFYPPPVWLHVKEVDLDAETDQNDMSQGMFRALSLIIQLNYAIMLGVRSCVLIDDIGEGLDYARSTGLIKLVIDKALKHSLQLIMATNDRFVMNNVPLEYWSLVHRVGNTTQCFNCRNEPDLFEEFKLTGLNNFDFFASDYISKYLSKNA